MRGGKNEGIFHYVIENKRWKNVRNRPFHYVDEKTGSYTRLSIILMKIKAVVRRDKLAERESDSGIVKDKGRMTSDHPSPSTELHLTAIRWVPILRSTLFQRFGRTES
jgi:hypothetical protein